MSQRVPSGKLSAFRPEAGAVTDFTMYNPPEWNNVDIKPFKNSFDFQLDALNCGGVPTRTTPTLTPTTLKNIEQMFIELQSDPQTHQNEAGFVPPLLQPSTSVNNVSVTPPQQPPSSSTAHVGVVNNTAVSSNNGGNSIFMSMVDTKSWQGGITTVTDVPPLAHVNSNNLSAIPPHVISVVNSSHVAVSGNNNVPLNDSNHTNTIGSTTTTHRRNIGGRRPNKENGISPEEEERRKLRRERNKLAAARCRKRRLDHTNELVEETEELEDKKQRLHEEIRQLQIQKEELEFLLEAHKPCCQLRYPDSPQDIKPYILDPPLTEDNAETIKAISNGIIVNKDDDDLNDGKLMIDEQRGGERPKIVVVSISNNLNKARPNSLPVTSTFMQTSTATANSITDVPITTPSAGLGLNFDSFLEGATGYTPITSSMSCFVVPSCAVQQRNCNNSNNNGDLISPDTVPSKLVSL